MASPFPKSTSSPGEGELIARLLPEGKSALSKMSFQYPLKLISPSPTSYQKSVMVFLLTYGGGLVGGDQVNLKIQVDEGARLSIVTQGHTKIFKSPSMTVVTRQNLVVNVAADASLCLLPDPVQPFAGSQYEQRQTFRVEETANIAVLDWVSQGRAARGENWDFHGWQGRNEVWSVTSGLEKPRGLLLRDNVILTSAAMCKHGMEVMERMHGHGLFGTFILKGAQVEKLATFFTAEFVLLPRIGARDFRTSDEQDHDQQMKLTSRELWRIARLRQEKEDAVLWSTARVRNCTVIKFGAKTVEGARHWFGSMLHEEGTIANLFGEDALICVRP